MRRWKRCFGLSHPTAVISLPHGGLLIGLPEMRLKVFMVVIQLVSLIVPVLMLRSFLVSGTGTGAYGSVSKDDLIRKMRTAHRKTKFRSPVSHDTPKQGGMQNGIYTNSDVIGLVEEILEAQNMNLGNDVASKDGKACFKSSPLVYVPYLDNDSTDPVYMLDWQWLLSVYWKAGKMPCLNLLRFLIIIMYAELIWMLHLIWLVSILAVRLCSIRLVDRLIKK